MSQLQGMTCPSCASRMHYRYAEDWWVCELCDGTLGGEVYWRRSRSRLGRLWLRVFTR